MQLPPFAEFLDATAIGTCKYVIEKHLKYLRYRQFILDIFDDPMDLLGIATQIIPNDKFTALTYQDSEITGYRVLDRLKSFNSLWSMDDLIIISNALYIHDYIQTDRTSPEFFSSNCKYRPNRSKISYYQAIKMRQAMDSSKVRLNCAPISKCGLAG